MQGHAGAIQLERWITPTPAWSAKRIANGLIYPVECTQMGGSGCVFVTYFGRRKPT